MTTPRTSFSLKLTKPQQERLFDILALGNYRPIQVEYTQIAAQTEGCTIALYTSGKCVVQGKNAEDFMTFVMEPGVLQSAGLGYEKILNPQMVKPRMGIDESGKGDFFGPIVIAGAFADEALVDEMQKMKVRDSKMITSDDVALDLGRDLRRLLGRRFTVVKIGPAAYNRLYTKMRSVNKILGWAHARAIENLLDVIPGCPLAISDQFGSKEQVIRALMKKGRKIELEQRHKAESDLAVAAASILAREGFLRALAEMKERYGQVFPKGASPAVKAAAVNLVKSRGPQILLETAKCHFRTADQVLETAGASRKDLGPDGQAVSKVMDRASFVRKTHGKGE
jgi:ribonuclease HIII